MKLCEKNLRKRLNSIPHNSKKVALCNTGFDYSLMPARLLVYAITVRRTVFQSPALLPQKEPKKANPKKNRSSTRYFLNSEIQIIRWLYGIR